MASPAAAEISDSDLEKASPSELLALAAFLGRTDLAVAALRQDAPINALTPHPADPSVTQTALHAAVRKSHVDVTRALLASSASLNVRDSLGKTPVEYLPPRGDEPAPIWYVLGGDLCQKAARGDAAGVRDMLDAGVAVDVVDSAELRNTPLHWAASFGSFECVRLLVTRGARVDSVNAAGNTPLIDAAIASHLVVVRELVAVGADPHFRDKAGRAVVDLPVSDEVLGALHRREAPATEILVAESVTAGTDAAVPPTPYYVPGERPFAGGGDLPNWARLLWPRPQRIVEAGGVFSVPPVLTVSAESACLEVGRMLVGWLRELRLDDVSVRLVGGGQGGLGEGIAFSASVFLRTDEHALERGSQAYSLSVREFGVDVVGSDLSGLFYGCATLVNVLQLRKGSSDESVLMSVPTFNASDYPSLRRRGLYLDVSGRRVPKLETLRELVSFMSLRLKMNQLHLNIGDNFDRLRGVPREGLLTHEEILELNLWCKSHFVELIPVVDSSSLENVGDDYRASNGVSEERLQETRRKAMLEKEMLFDEFIPLFDSEQVNLGNMNSTVSRGPDPDGAPEERGLADVASSLRSRGKRTILGFADSMVDALMDTSSLLAVLAAVPARSVMILEASRRRAAMLEDSCLLFRQHGLPFYTCVSSCLEESISGRLSILLERGRSAVHAATEQGAVGVIIKDVSMSSQGAPLAFLYQALLPIAGAAWNSGNMLMTSSSGPDELLTHLYDTFLFRDRPEKGILGSIAVSLGDLHHIAGDSSGDALFRLLSQRYNDGKVLDKVTYLGLRRVVKRADRMENALSSYNGNAHQNDVNELRSAAIFVSVAARIGALLLSASSAASMDGERLDPRAERDLGSLPDGRRSDLCNALLQSIELLRASWVNQYQVGGFAETVELTVGTTLSKLAKGMPYERYLEERKAEAWVPVDE